MALFQRRRGPEPAPVTTNGSTREPQRAGESAYFELKTRIHRQLIERLDLTKLATLPQEAVQQQIQRIVEDMLATDETPLSRQEREQLVVEVQHETFGLGPIEPLMQDPTVSDILVNGPRAVYVERRGRLERTRVIFRDDTHLLQVIERIVSAVGRRVDESSPMVDARLPDGSRVNAIIPPLALDGPVLSIRRFAVDPLKTEDLLELGTWTPALSEIIRAAVKARLNILISGGTGSGKTTLLNVISEAIPNHERIVTVEDSAELQLQQEHKVRLETRPANVEGAGSVTQRDLVRNALRMRPDRIILGEVRGAEVLDMLQAMNTGHDGSMGTLHANNPREGLSRLESMITMGGFTLPSRTIREMICASVDVVIQAARLRDGSRRITHITEVMGLEGDVIIMQDLFVYELIGEDAQGNLIGRHRSTGIGRPRFWERARYYGEEKNLAAALDAAEQAAKTPP